MSTNLIDLIIILKNYLKNLFSEEIFLIILFETILYLVLSTIMRNLLTINHGRLIVKIIHNGGYIMMSKFK